jgi:hypothetical protein
MSPWASNLYWINGAVVSEDWSYLSVVSFVVGEAVKNCFLFKIMLGKSVFEFMDGVGEGGEMSQFTGSDIPWSEGVVEEGMEVSVSDKFIEFGEVRYWERKRGCRGSSVGR